MNADPGAEPEPFVLTDVIEAISHQDLAVRAAGDIGEQQVIR